jgi:PAS domain S-box-containing protein
MPQAGSETVAADGPVTVVPDTSETACARMHRWFGRLSVRQKILIPWGIAFFLVLMGMLVLGRHLVERETRRRAQAAGQSVARFLVTSAAESKDRNELIRVARGFFEEPEVAGILIATGPTATPWLLERPSLASPTNAIDRARRDHLERALASHGTADLDPAAGDRVCAVLPVGRLPGVVGGGWVVVLTEGAPLRRDLHAQVRWALGLTGGAVAVLCVFAGWLVSRFLGRPLAKLGHLVGEAAGETPSAPPELDEIHQVIASVRHAQDRLRIQADHDRLLSRLSEVLVQPGSLDETLEEYVRVLLSEGGFALGRIWLVDSTSDRLRLRINAGVVVEPDEEDDDVPSGLFFAGRVAAERRLLVNHRLGRQRGWVNLAWARENQLSSVVALPLVASDQVVGVLAVFARTLPAPWLPETLEQASEALALTCAARQLAEQASVREQQLSDLVENATVGMHWMDFEGVIRRVNRAELELLGYPEAHYVGRPVADFYADGRVFEDLMRRLVAGETVRDFEARLVHADGSVREVLIDASVCHVDGRFLHARCLTRDVTESRRIARALRESEERFRGAWHHSGVGYALVQLGGRFFELNPAMCRMFGYQPDELVKLNFRDVTHPDDVRESDENLRRLVIGEIPTLTIEKRYRRKDGQIFWGQVSASVVRTDSGRPLYFVAQINDITSRRDAEARLSELNLSLQHAVEGIARLDASGRYVEVNPAYARLCGYQSDDLLGRDWSQTVHVSDRPSMVVAYSRMLVEGKVSTSCRGVRRDGSLFHKEVTMVAIYNAAGEPEGHHCFLRDITARREAEQKLLTAKETIEAALDEARVQKFAIDQHAIVAITDLTGTITYANGKFCEISGYAREELVGQNHRILSSGTHPREFWTAMFKTISAGEVWRGEVHNRAKDGHDYWVQTTIVPVLNARGKPTRYIAIRSDITARKLAEGSLARARDTADSANRAKSEFLAMMSHEIRTPMNGVLGFTQLLLDTPLSGEQRDFAHTIKGCGEALLGLLNDILDFSKIEAGKLSVESMDFDLRNVLEEVLVLLSARAYEKGLTLALRCPSGTPTNLRGDPTRVRQVLLNLAGNALKFTHEGHVLIDVTADADDLTVSIRDTGIGIPVDKQARLFQRFAQADSSTTRKFGGTGLGLAISRSLVELMGGNIGLTSENGRGSTFWFTLPITHAGVTPGLGPIEEFAGQRALIVVRTPVKSRLLDEQLSLWGIARHAAASAADGIIAMTEAPEPFTFVLLEHSVADDFFERLQQQPALRPPTIILLSRVHQPHDEESLRARGIQGCVVTPLIRCEMLRSALIEAVSQPVPVSIPSSATMSVASLDAAPDPAPDEAVVAAPQRSVRVLLVEDNTTNQILAKRMLSKLGCQVDIAGNGIEGVQRASGEVFDLIFMDGQMPEMDGFTATGKIRDLERILGRHTPIVALTANAMAGDRERCLAAGMDDYITKPIRREDLERALSRWVETPVAQP